MPLSVCNSIRTHESGLGLATLKGVKRCEAATLGKDSNWKCLSYPSFICLDTWIFHFYTHTHRQADRTYFINYLSQLIALCVRVCPVQGTGYRDEKIPYELSAPAGETFPDTFATHFQQFL